MRSSAELDLKYASKQSSISNGWKKMKGESKGLRESDAVSLKKEYERGFNYWASSHNATYSKILPDLENLYKVYTPYLHTNDFYTEAAFTPEILALAESFRNLNDAIAKNDSTLSKKIEELRNDLPGFYKDYDTSTDKLLFASLLKLFDANVADSLKPSLFMDMRNRYKGDFGKMAEGVFSKSVLHDSVAVYNMLKLSPSKLQQKLMKDEAYRLSDMLHEKYDQSVLPRVTLFGQQAGRLNRMYMAAQRQYQPERIFYPDANSTLRVTYGKVKGYQPRDGVYYTYQTYLDGVIEKYVPGDEEFDLPAKILELYKNKDYGQYAVNGKLPVAFIAANHTTGGNSGSPVINAKGELIGTNYDRVWEGTMSDVLYNPNICRNVTLDIRYTLFIIDKYANAQRLINEMQLMK